MVKEEGGNGAVKEEEGKKKQKKLQEDKCVISPAKGTERYTHVCVEWPKCDPVATVRHVK